MKTLMTSRFSRGQPRLEWSNGFMPFVRTNIANQELRMSRAVAFSKTSPECMTRISPQSLTLRHGQSLASSNGSRKQGAWTMTNLQGTSEHCQGGRKSCAFLSYSLPRFEILAMGVHRVCSPMAFCQFVVRTSTDCAISKQGVQHWPGHGAHCFSRKPRRGPRRSGKGW